MAFSYDGDFCSTDIKNEKDLLKRIKERFAQDSVYCFVDDIVIVVNPCKALPLCGFEAIKEYHDGKDRPPHVYRVAELALHRIQVSGRSQCVIMTGDSGAGKTDTAKHLVEYITNIAPTTDMELRKFLQAGKVLEAFGNAWTATSDNASRFIKLTDLLFAKDSKLIGGYIHHYMLEKTRMISHAKDERTFNIFYHFLIGMDEDELNRFYLERSVYHRYTGSNFDWESDIEEEQVKLAHTLQHLESVGFSEQNKTAIFSVLSAILHVGDLTFSADVRQQRVAVNNFETLKKGITLPCILASALLGVTPDELELAFVTDFVFSKGSLVRRLRTVSEAGDARDAMSMALYTRLFASIVWKINEHLMAYDENDNYADSRKISILDPFGFESLAVNGFEQLCINTVNEQLMYFYNQHVFVWEQADRESESPLFQRIQFPDNRDAVELLLERPFGIFAMIEQDCKSAKSTDTSLVKKLNSKHRKHPCYGVANFQYPAFTVGHYAGKVTYVAVNSLAKNRDVVGGSIIKCLQGSTDELVNNLFKVRLSGTGTILGSESHFHWSTLPHGALKKSNLKKMRGTVRRKTEMIGNVQGFAKTSPSKMYLQQDQGHATLTGQLRNSLADLLDRMLSCDVHFVRCIRPNRELIPDRFDGELVAAQLRYSGVMETIDMRQQGFPIRIAFAVFIERYKVLAFQMTANVKYSGDTCEKIMSKTNSEGWTLGKTKIFMKNGCRNNLDDLLDAAIRGIIIVQKLYRGHLARLILRKLKWTQQQEKRAADWFFTELQDRLDTVYHHICNQVSEEDQRTKCSNWQHSNEQVKEKALGILEGRPVITRSASSSSTLVRPWDRFASTSTPVQPMDDEIDSSPVPQATLSVVDAFDFKDVHTLDPVSPATLSIVDAFGSGPRTNSTPISTARDSVLTSVPDSPSALSIVDAFGPGSDSDNLSPGPWFDIEGPVDTSTNSVADGFGSPRASNESGEELTPGMSIVDAFMFSFSDDSKDPDGTASIVDVFGNSPNRPRLTGRDSNLSAISVESVLSQVSGDEDMDVARAVSGLWCKITCCERDISRGEFMVDRSVMIVDGSSNAFDVTRIGLGGLPMRSGDARVDKVRRCIGKGIKLAIDEEGSMWVKRCSKNVVFVKGYYLSCDVWAANGALPKDKLMKVFDYEAFVKKLEHDCQPKRFSPEKAAVLLSSVIVCFSFVKDSEHDVDTPCWIEVEMTEAQRITNVAVKLAKERRREEKEKRGQRTPPILRAKIGKSRQIIAVGAFEKLIRPGRYIDSFKFGRREWARKKVALSPFTFGEQSTFSPRDRSETAKKERADSSPGNLEDLTLHDEFANEEWGPNSDDAFSPGATDIHSREFGDSDMGTSTGVKGRERTKSSPDEFVGRPTDRQLLTHHKPRLDDETKGQKSWAKKKNEAKGAQKLNGRHRSKTPDMR